MKKYTTIAERILQLIDFKKINRNKFGKALGYDRSQAVYDILNGKSMPSYDFFNKFLKSEYSEQININWLITGDGEMLIHDRTFTNSNITSETEHLLNIIQAKEDIIASMQATISTQRSLIEAKDELISELKKGLSPRVSVAKSVAR